MITKHGAQRLMERGGINVSALRRLLGNRQLPDGQFSVPDLGTVIIKGGKIVTLLAPEMTVVRR